MMTAYEIAKRLGRKDPSYIYKVLKGKRRPSAVLAKQIEEISQGQHRFQDLRPDLVKIFEEVEMKLHPNDHRQTGFSRDCPSPVE
jgi:DNA-binding transcriptional regulator YdaS (Cro superfamily)